MSKDLVLWLTNGFGHTPHMEQYPVMNSEEFTYYFTPHNFFDENPDLDIDPDTSITSKYYFQWDPK